MKTSIDARKYRFMLTIARRDGIEDIRVRALVNSGKLIEVRLPPGIDGCDMEQHIKKELQKSGLAKPALRYLGSKLKQNGNDLVRFFDFECSCKAS
ncbi:MAG: hypothetical protein V1492_02030 [Candidatus Micrarchaeota archaeon]